jgi:hypothetical protein
VRKRSNASQSRIVPGMGRASSRRRKYWRWPLRFEGLRFKFHLSVFSNLLGLLMNMFRRLRELFGSTAEPKVSGYQPKDADDEAKIIEALMLMWGQAVFSSPSEESPLRIAAMESPGALLRCQIEAALLLLWHVDYSSHGAPGDAIARKAATELYRRIPTWFPNTLSHQEEATIWAERGRLYGAAFSISPMRLGQAYAAILGYAINGGGGLMTFGDEATPSGVVAATIEDRVSLNPLVAKYVVLEIKYIAEMALGPLRDIAGSPT